MTKKPSSPVPPIPPVPPTPPVPPVPPRTSAAPSDASTRHTIDDLAAISRVPSRTIRFYQSKGALPAPEIVGRVAYYNDHHLERLRLIAQLQDRGLNMRAICDLAQGLDKGSIDLSEWLGLDRTLQAPWSHDLPEVLDAQTVAAQIGNRPGAIAELVKHGFLEKKGTAYLVASPALLRIVLRMESAGIDLALATTMCNTLRKHVARAADELAGSFIKHAGKGFGRRATAQDLSAAYEVFQPLGLESAQLLFGQEMEKSMRKQLGAGKSTAFLNSSKSTQK